MGSQTPAPVAEKKEVGKRHVAVLIDESGSMGPVQAAVVDAINEYLDGLRDHKNARVTLAFFDKYNAYEPKREVAEPVVRYIAIGDKLAKINRLTSADYNPRGWTPLYQAIRDLIHRVDTQVGPGGVAMVVIYTDGHENASEGVTADEVKRLIAKRRALQGWDFVFLGADIDAWAASKKFGLDHAGGTFNVSNTRGGLQGTAGAMTTTTISYLGGMTALDNAASRARTYGDTIVPVGNDPKPKKKGK